MLSSLKIDNANASPRLVNERSMAWKINLLEFDGNNEEFTHDTSLLLGHRNHHAGRNTFSWRNWDHIVHLVQYDFFKLEWNNMLLEYSKRRSIFVQLIVTQLVITSLN